MSSDNDHQDDVRQDGAVAAEAVEDINAPMIFIVGIVFTLVFLVVVILLMALYNRAERSELERRVTQQRHEEVNQLRAQQLERLGAYGWVDPAQGAVSVPIDRAMELTRQRLASGELLGFEQLGLAQPTPLPYADETTTEPAAAQQPELPQNKLLGDAE